MKRLCALSVLAAALAAVPGAAAEAVWPQRYAAYGQMLAVPMASAPFPHAKRAGGYTYEGELYSAEQCYTDNTVALFVPEGFRAGPAVDLVIHCHGWRGRVEEVLPRYQLAEQLAASRRNAVLVVPQGPRNAPDSFGGQLEDPDGLRHLVDEVLAVLRDRGLVPPESRLGQIVLSCHSGGGRAVAEMLAVGGLADRVSEVWLFDAMYGRSEKYLAWFDQRHRRLVSIYTDGGGTKGQNEALMALLKQRGTPFVQAEDTQLGPDALRVSMPVFLHTDLAHDDVLSKRWTFRALAASSALAPVPAPAGPAHLHVAWDLLTRLQPADTSYRHGQPDVSFAGTGRVHTDCSGFIAELLAYAYGCTPDQLRGWFGRVRPTAARIHDAIVAGKGFDEIRDVHVLRPGDIMAMKLLDPKDDTGHAMLVAGLPRRLPEAKPLRPGTEQWAVPIIDTSKSGHGPSDTRHGQGEGGKGHTGLGQGVLRLYVGADGGVVGYTWSPASITYCAQDDHMLVIGRFRP